MSNFRKLKYNLIGKKVFVAGHTGMVGSAIIRKLKKINCECLTVSSHELDLRNIEAVDNWFERYKPDTVFMAAAKVGGIYANDTYPVDFLHENLSIQNSIISNAYKHNIKKLMFLGSSCIYPKNAKQPLKESSLLTGPLENTNESYAVAKIAGVKLCQAYRKQYNLDYISVMPTNLYGIGDNFHPKNSHVVAALIAKFYKAVKEGHKEVVLWGTGKPYRDFLNVDDLADGLVFIMENYSNEEPINIGSAQEISIKEFAAIIKNISGWRGKIIFDNKSPDGMPRKVMDLSKINKLGWKHSINLNDGLASAYKWYSDNYNNVRRV